MRTLMFIACVIIVAMISRPGYAQLEITTVTAQGTGKIPAVHCVAIVVGEKEKTVCGVSGSGTNYSFKFTGKPFASLEGTVSIHDADFGIRVESDKVVGVIDPASNLVKWSGTCAVFDALSQKVDIVSCSGSALDQGEPGTEDVGEFTYGGLKEGPATGKGTGHYMSGGAQID
jgi:hypothetical protein